MKKDFLSNSQTLTKPETEIKMSLEQKENMIDFLKVIFSEDLTDYENYSQHQEFTFL